MKSKKILLAVLLSLLTVGVMVGFALAIPADTVIVGGNAYSFEYFTNDPEAILAVAEAITNNDPIYVKMGEGVILNVVTDELVDGSVLPAVTYYDADGNTTSYGAGDSDDPSGVTMTATFTTTAVVLEYEMGKVNIELNGLEDAAKFTITYNLAGKVQTTEPAKVSESSITIPKTDKITVLVYNADGDLLATFADARYGVPCTGVVEDDGGEFKVESIE
jgi:hypothetical protein